MQTSTDKTGPRSKPAIWLVSIIVLAVLGVLGFFGWRTYSQAAAMAATRNPVVPAFSADGAQLAISVDQRTELYTSAGYSPALSLAQAAGSTETATAFAPDGKTLLVNHSAWDAAAGTERYTLGSIEAFRVAYKADGSQLAVFSFDGLYIYDAASGAQLAHLKTASGCSCQTALAFSGDGQIVSAAIDGVKTWDIASGQMLNTWKREGFSNALTLSSDGKTLAVSEGTAVQLYDVASGQKLRDLQAAPGAVNLLVFSPDGRRLAGDPANNGAAVWDVASGKLLHSLAIPARIAGLSFTTGGERLAAGAYDGKVRVYDDAGSLLKTIDFTDWGALLSSSFK